MLSFKPSNKRATFWNKITIPDNISKMDINEKIKELEPNDVLGVSENNSKNVGDKDVDIER